MGAFETNWIDTIGLEVEGVALSKDVMEHLMRDRTLSVTRDASVESIVFALTSHMNLFAGSKLVKSGRFLSPGTQLVYGYELVTTPLERDRMIEKIIGITTSLKRHGEIFSPRSSVHVHIGFPPGLVFMKNALRFGRRVEPLFYKIAGMENEYRGKINKSAYARPLELPPAVRIVEGGYFQLSPDRALQATNYYDFMDKFGMRPGDTNRYSPLRYFGLNLFSIILRGTLEFRFFNFSAKHQSVIAVTELSQVVADICARADKCHLDMIKPVSLFDQNSDATYIEMLDDIMRMARYYNSPYEIDDTSYEALIDLIVRTPQPIFKDEVVKTHLAKYSLSKRDGWGLPEVRAEDVVDPGTIDVHNFASMETSLL